MERPLLRKILLQSIALILVLLLTAACTPRAEAPTATLPPLPPATETAQGPAPTDAPAGAPTETQPPAEPTESGELPLGDASLKASDPTAASLAAGHPQLVEFFAFW